MYIRTTEFHWIHTMSTLANQLTIEQAPKEFNFSVDKIVTRYKQLDSSKHGVVGTPVFNAKSAEFTSLFALMTQLYHRLNLPMPTQLHRLPFFKH